MVHRAPRRFSPTLPLIVSAAAMTPSRVPYWSATLPRSSGRTLSTPGMLSMGSPDQRQVVDDAAPAARRICADAVSIQARIGHRVDQRHVVADELRHVLVAGGDDRLPALFVACRASVPMTSSASTPGTINSGSPMARMMSCMGSICSASSPGIGGRFALYSAYRSSRNVLPRASNTTAMGCPVLLRQLAQHGEDAAHRARMQAAGRFQIGERVKGPKQIRRAIHEQQGLVLPVVGRSVLGRHRISSRSSRAGAILCQAQRIGSP